MACSPQPPSRRPAGAATLTLCPGRYSSWLNSQGHAAALEFNHSHVLILSSRMTLHTPRLLTPEEFASLIEVAVTSPNPAIPAPHLAKLVALGYVAVTAKGPVVTGDGLIRITESE
jgi:hypothetical protein